MLKFSSMILIANIALVFLLSGCKISGSSAFYDSSEGISIVQDGTIIKDDQGDEISVRKRVGSPFYDATINNSEKEILVVDYKGRDGFFIIQERSSSSSRSQYYLAEVLDENRIAIITFGASQIKEARVGGVRSTDGFLGGKVHRAPNGKRLEQFYAYLLESKNFGRKVFTLDKPLIQSREDIEEKSAADEANRQRLVQEQNKSVRDKEKKVLSFSDGTELSFCISESTIMSSVKAASEQNYFTFLNRLDSLNQERLCTGRLSMQNIQEMEAAVEFWEDDNDTGRIFMIGSIARNYFSNCPPCDDLRPSDRLYFVTYNEVGGDQYGWKGYEQFIVANRTVGGIMDFLLSE